jgi:hypothetical protein
MPNVLPELPVTGTDGCLPGYGAVKPSNVQDGKVV